MIDIDNIFCWLEAAEIRFRDTQEQKNLGLDLLAEEYCELIKGIENNDKEGIKDGACDLIWIIVNNLLFNDITLEEFKQYFDKVSQSNWSKFCNSEKEAFDTVKAYQTGTHWDKPNEIIECYSIQIDKNLWGVFRNDGKILKSLNYKSLNSLTLDEKSIQSN